MDVPLSLVPSGSEKKLCVVIHAEPEIFLISPGFIFRQEGTNELSAAFLQRRYYTSKWI